MKSSFITNYKIYPFWKQIIQRDDGNITQYIQHIYKFKDFVLHYLACTNI